MPRKTSTSSTTSPRTERPSWRGQLNFGLVSFAVEAFNALDRSQGDIHFHQLHAKCHSRISYQKVCPIHGKVSNDEIVSGYEVSEGRYVEFDPDDLNALRTEREKGLTIDTFVAPGTVDPLYFDGRMYYLYPGNASSHEAFDVVVKAMELEEKEGVGRIVMSGKDQIVLLRPMNGILQMAMLNYAEEIKPAKPSGDRKVSASSKQMKIAQSLVQQWTDESFDFAQYKDDYREQVETLINAKVKGHQIEQPEGEAEEPATLNLMDALQKSLGRSKSPTNSKPVTKPARRTKRSKTA